MNIDSFVKKVKPIDVAKLHKIKGGQTASLIIIEIPIPKTDK